MAKNDPVKEKPGHNVEVNGRNSDLEELLEDRGKDCRWRKGFGKR